ncbi:hypothetical protein EWM64_g2622 [Hericium alpestre]|uniref:NAD(P)-binding protein n=1 Tax=Hericium alpestre TaxID=135208 RepID=A0A4Z0A3U7_9AGAM|nr:hypothetical protein EWM64_g2622 [Hericium alpestre]
MGNALAVYKDTFPPSPTYSVDDVPDLSGKIIIVTGGNTGLGKETIKVLLQHNATVYLAARSPSKAKAAIDELRDVTGKEALFLQLDLSDLKSVKESARQFLEKEKKLDVLLNNAGVMMSPIEQLTKDGYDLQFGTNVLGHFYFTKLLLPLLLSTAKTTGEARVVTLSSGAGLMVDEIDFNTLKDSPARKNLGTTKLYMQSKLGNMVVSLELARRYADQGIISTSINPGTLKSDLARHVHSLIYKLILKIISYPVPMGTLSSLYAATHPDGKSLNGKYLKPWAREGELSKTATDPELGKELWTWMEEQVAPFESNTS